MPSRALVHQAPWMSTAWEELGQAEIPGSHHNPRIQAYLAATSIGNHAADEIPWCSAFVNWVLAHNGYGTTKSAMARSWMREGLGVVWTTLTMGYGDVVVLMRGVAPQGHVGFCVGITPTEVVLLGGNQGDRVSVQPFARGRVLTVRQPLLVVIPGGTTPV